MPLPEVTVVTPWHEHLDLADDFWKAVSVAGQGCHVLVVDNGSEPPLPNALRLDRNEGFSFACNIGLAAARTDAVLFLNNDVAATHTNWLQPIRQALEPGVLVGANLRNDPHAWVDGQPMPYLDGWCLAGMRDDLLDLGGWDETLDEPAYYGDNILSLEARAAGMTLREVRAGIHHKLNGTAKPDDPRTVAATAANRETYIHRARELLVAA